jgi:hypothetical protein
MLKRIGDDVWAHERDIRMPGGVSLPARATIVRLTGGELLLHSPLPIDDETGKAIDALGDVRFIVAPNCFHWLSLKAAKDRYPKARVHAPAGLARKAGSFEFEKLPERGDLDGAVGVRALRIDGAPSMEEHVFLHEVSQSLIVTDLLFNVHECRSLMMRLYFRLMGAWKKPAQSKLWRFLVKDRPAAAQSAAEMLAWDFDRVIVAHGDVIELDARQQARDALAWMRSGAPRLLTAAAGDGTTAPR